MKDEDFDKLNDSSDSQSFNTEIQKSSNKNFDKKTRKKLKSIHDKLKMKNKKLQKKA